MSINNLKKVTELFINDVTIDVATVEPLRTTNKNSEDDSRENVTSKIAATRASESKDLVNSRSSDSGKSSTCSPTLLDCSFDSGIAGVLLDSNNMQLHKQIQQCQRIILALERDREHFSTIRNRLSKITERKKKQSNDSEFFCNVCCAEIDPEDAKTYVKCYICQKHICRSIKCADWLAQTAQWECELCQNSKESMAQTSSWVADQISFNQEKLVYPIRARSEIFIPISECNDSSIHFESVSQIGANTAAVTAEQKLKIREYVEEVVANLLGGNLDTISVNQLSKSENYLPVPKSNGSFGQQNGSVLLNNSQSSREVTPISANVPDFTHISETRLRQMILKIIAETQSMPLSLATTHAVSEISLDRLGKAAENMPLTNGHRHRTEHYFEPTIYQDLLATAVLNKIVDKQLNSHDIAERLPDITRGHEGGCVINAVLDENFNVEHHSITSGSSVEPRSDCSYTDMDQILNTNEDKSLETDIINADRESVMSDYLANHMVPLPNLSEMATESEEDDYMSVTSSAVGDCTWENNWLFKKKKPSVGGTVAATSIGMLVPDPKEDVRAKIGDKAADEVSDLSELGSDTDDSSLDILRSKLDPINDRLVNKHLIGGQNSKVVLDELIERSSMISNTLPADLEEALTETCNEHVIDASTQKSQAINVDVKQQPSCNPEQEGSGVILPPAGFEDLNSNPLTANDDFTESDSCTGFSTIEIVEQTVHTASVFEILAAMSLGPMLAIPAVDEPTTVTASELTALNELKDLALAEIKARYVELTPHSLCVIPEEPGEHCIDIKCIPPPDEICAVTANEFENNLTASSDDSNFMLDSEENDETIKTDSESTIQYVTEIKSNENKSISEDLEKTDQSSDSITTLKENLTTCDVENMICPNVSQPLFKTVEGSFESASQNSEEIISKPSEIQFAESFVPNLPEVINSNLEPLEKCNQLEEDIISKGNLKQPLDEFNTTEAPNKISLAEESAEEIPKDAIQPFDDTLPKIQPETLSPVSNEENTFKTLEHNEASVHENTVEYNPLQEENKIIETECIEGSTAQYADNYSPTEEEPSDEHSVVKTTQAMMETPETKATCENILSATETQSLCEMPVTQYTEEFTLTQMDKDVIDDTASNCVNPDEQTENSILESTLTVIEINENLETSILKCSKGEAQSENQEIDTNPEDCITQSIEQYSETIRLPSEGDEKLLQKDNISQTTQLEIETSEESDHPPKTKCDISEAGQFSEIAQLECEKQFPEIPPLECTKSENVTTEEHNKNELIVPLENNISEIVHSELIGHITEANTSETPEHIPNETTILQNSDDKISDSSNYQCLKSETPETQTTDNPTQQLIDNNITPQSESSQVTTPSNETECDTQLAESKNINLKTASCKDLSENIILNTEAMEYATILTTNCDDSKMTNSNLNNERENNIEDIISTDCLMENTIGERKSSDDKESLSQLTKESETTVQLNDESREESNELSTQSAPLDISSSDLLQENNSTAGENIEKDKELSQCSPLTENIPQPSHLESIESSTGLSERAQEGITDRENFESVIPPITESIPDSNAESSESLRPKDEIILKAITTECYLLDVQLAENKCMENSSSQRAHSEKEEIPDIPLDCSKSNILDTEISEFKIQQTEENAISEATKESKNILTETVLSETFEFSTQTTEVSETTSLIKNNITAILTDTDSNIALFEITSNENYIPNDKVSEAELEIIFEESVKAPYDEKISETEISEEITVTLQNLTSETAPMVDSVQLKPQCELALSDTNHAEESTNIEHFVTENYIPDDKILQTDIKLVIEDIEAAKDEITPESEIPVCSLSDTTNAEELVDQLQNPTSEITPSAESISITQSSIEELKAEIITETEISGNSLSDTTNAEEFIVLLQNPTSESATLEDSISLTQPYNETIVSDGQISEKPKEKDVTISEIVLELTVEESIEAPKYEIISESEILKCSIPDKNDAEESTVRIQNSISEIVLPQPSNEENDFIPTVALLEKSIPQDVLVEDVELKQPYDSTTSSLTKSKCALTDTNQAEESTVTLTTTSLIEDNITVISTDNSNIALFVTENNNPDDKIPEQGKELIIEESIEKSIEAPKDEITPGTEILVCPLSDTTNAEELVVPLQNPTAERTPSIDSTFKTPPYNECIFSDDKISEKQSLNCVISEIQHINELNYIISETELSKCSESFPQTTEKSETTLLIEDNLTEISTDNSNIGLLAKDDTTSAAVLEINIEESIEAPKDEKISESEIEKCSMPDTNDAEESTVTIQNSISEIALSDSIPTVSLLEKSLSEDLHVENAELKQPYNSTTSSLTNSKCSLENTNHAEESTVISETDNSYIALFATENNNSDDKIPEPDKEIIIEESSEAPKDEITPKTEIPICSLSDTTNAKELVVPLQNPTSERTPSDSMFITPPYNECILSEDNILEKQSLNCLISEIQPTMEVKHIVSETEDSKCSESFPQTTEKSEITLLIEDNNTAILIENLNIALLVKDDTISEAVLEFPIEESIHAQKDEKNFESEISKCSIPDINNVVETLQNSIAEIYLPNCNESNDIKSETVLLESSESMILTTELAETPFLNEDKSTAISTDNTNIALSVKENNIPEDKISEPDKELIIEESIEAPKDEITPETKIPVCSLSDTTNTEELVVPLQNSTSESTSSADSIFITPPYNECVLPDDQISEKKSLNCLISEIQPITELKHITSETEISKCSESIQQTTEKSETTSLIEDNITAILTDNSNTALLVMNDTTSEAVLEINIEESIEAPKDGKISESEIAKCSTPDTNDAEESTVTLENSISETVLPQPSIQDTNVAVESATLQTSISETYLPTGNESKGIVSETVLFECSQSSTPTTEVSETASLIKDIITATSTDNANIALLVTDEKVLEFTIEESIEEPRDKKISESEILKCAIPDTNYAEESTVPLRCDIQPTNESNDIIPETVHLESSESCIAITEVSETTSLIKENITGILPDNTNTFATENCNPDDKVSEPSLELITEESIEERKDEIISETEITVHSSPDTTNTEEFIVQLQYTTSENTPLTDSIFITPPYNEALLSDGLISEKTSSKCLISEIQPTTESNDIISETVLSENSESNPQTTKKSETTSLVEDNTTAILTDNSNNALLVKDVTISEAVLEFPIEESILAPKDETISESEILKCSILNKNDAEESTVTLQNSISETNLPSNESNDIISESVLLESSESIIPTTEISETTLNIKDNSEISMDHVSNIAVFVTENNNPDDKIPEPDIELIIEESIEAPKDTITSESEIPVCSLADAISSEESISESEIAKCSIPDTNNEVESLHNSVSETKLPSSNESNDIILETVLLKSSESFIPTTKVAETTALIEDNITASTENYIPDDKISEPDLELTIEESVDAPKDEKDSESEIAKCSIPDTNDAVDSIENSISETKLPSSNESNVLVSETVLLESSDSIIPTNEVAATTSLIEDNITAISTDNSKISLLVKDDIISEAVLEITIEELVEAPKDEKISEPEIGKYSIPDSNDAVESLQNSISETNIPSSNESNDRISETVLLESSESTPLIEYNITAISTNNTNTALFVTANKIPDNKIPEPDKELIIEESIEAPKDEITPETEIPVFALSDTINTEELVVPLQNPTSERTPSADSIFLSPPCNESNLSDDQSGEMESSKCLISQIQPTELITEIVLSESSEKSETTSLIEDNITSKLTVNSNIALLVKDDTISEAVLELTIEESAETPKDEKISESETSKCSIPDANDAVDSLQNSISETNLPCSNESNDIISETVLLESSESLIPTNEVSETTPLLKDIAISTDNTNVALFVMENYIPDDKIPEPDKELIIAELTPEIEIPICSLSDTTNTEELDVPLQTPTSESTPLADSIFITPPHNESILLDDQMSEMESSKCLISEIQPTLEVKDLITETVPSESSEKSETTSLIEDNTTAILTDNPNIALLVKDDIISEAVLNIEESVEAPKDKKDFESEIGKYSIPDTNDAAESLQNSISETKLPSSIESNDIISETVLLESSESIIPTNEVATTTSLKADNITAISTQNTNIALLVKDDIISEAVLELNIEESVESPKDEKISEPEIGKYSIPGRNDAEESTVTLQNSILETNLPSSNESNDIISETVLLENSETLTTNEVSESTPLIENNITAISTDNTNIAHVVTESYIPDDKILEPDLELNIDESVEAPKDEIIPEIEIRVCSLSDTTNTEELVGPLQNRTSESTPLADSIIIAPAYSESILSDDQISEMESSKCLISEIQPTSELKHLITETVLSESFEKSETTSLIEDNITSKLTDNSNIALLVKDDTISEAVSEFTIEESVEAPKDEEDSESEIAKCSIPDKNDAVDSIENSISETKLPSSNESNDITSETVHLETSESIIPTNVIATTASLIEDNITAILTDNSNIALLVKDDTISEAVSELTIEESVEAQMDEQISESEIAKFSIPDINDTEESAVTLQNPISETSEIYIPDDKILEPDIESTIDDSVEAPKNELVPGTENTVTTNADTTNADTANADTTNADTTNAEEFVVPLQNPTSETAPIADYNESVLSDGEILEKPSSNDNKISESEISICSLSDTIHAEESNVTLQQSITATVRNQPAISTTLASDAPPILCVKHDTVTKESSSTSPPTVLNDLISGSIEIVNTNTSSDERDSLDEIISPTLTRQSTVVEIGPAVSGPENNIIESVKTQSLDQLIYDTNRNDDSRTTTVKENIGIYPDESDILTNNFKISPPSTTNTTTTNYIHTNTITKKLAKSDMHHQHKSINDNNSKGPEKPSNNSLLTSAVQNHGSPACLEQHSSNERVSNRREAHDDNDGDSVGGVQVDLIEEYDEEEEVDDDDDEVAILRHFVPGSIAEREYNKWNNAVEMPNNPYAPEALKRRISGSQERFIDLPNISPTQEQNPLEILNKNKLDVEETEQRENDYKRYSRDYYINNGSPSPLTSPTREMAVTSPTKDHLETVQNIMEIDLYKAIPAQVVDDSISQQSIQSENTTTSDDSDTIRVYDFKKQATTTVLKDANTPQEVEGKAKAVVKPQVRPTNLTLNKSDLSGNVTTTAARGSTPTAFKFLQPKRKLVDPSQVLSFDEDESTPVISPPEKLAIEHDVIHALPSVKALARAFLMTAKANQPENRWLRKVKTLSKEAKKSPANIVKSINQTCLETAKVEEDVTITSDLSSLETDTSSAFIDTENTKDISSSSPPAEDKDAVALRQGGLKNNIAFFENLKFK